MTDREAAVEKLGDILDRLPDIDRDDVEFFVDMLIGAAQEGMAREEDVDYE